MTCIILLLSLQNSKYREEVLELSSRNLQLSNDNAELSARLRGDQESVRMLKEQLATVSKEQEEERATVRESDQLVLVLFLSVRVYMNRSAFSLSQKFNF